MKSNLHFEHVDLIVIDPSRSIRQALTDILFNQGFRKIRLGESLADLNTKVDIGMPDLVISDDHLPDGDLCDLIQSLRHHDVGHNPFVSIIATTWKPTPESVSRIVQTGVDDLVIKPLAPSTLFNHIKAQIDHRKPFVVTSSYIGPDRRGEEERNAGDDSEIDLLEVPNTLREKATTVHPLNPANLQNEIDAYLKIVNIQKLDRHADQAKILVEQIMQMVSKAQDDGGLKILLERLLFVAEDTARRMVDTPYAHVSELCQSLIGVTQSIIKFGTQDSAKDVQLLTPLAQAIRKGFDDSSEEISKTVREITSSVLTRH
ncbi:two-component system response regulator [Pseudomonadota bacterium]